MVAEAVRLRLAAPNSNSQRKVLRFIMKIRANCGTFRCAKGSYHPTGKLREHGSAHRQNPASILSKKTIAARVFVGLSVKNKPKWSANDVIKIVSAERKRQVGDPSASFLSQIGVYQHHDSGEIVREKSVQIVLIDTHGTSLPEFTKQVTELGELLAKKLKQESVIVDVQVNGVSRSVWWVTP